ncbi:MAG: phage integrase family protein [Burkholderiaceae bacterium]|nr:phage integrase family protein [Burkholderiaceae bacterium]
MRLTREHFRFLSGAVQGLDLHALWDRYLYALGAADLRRIRSVTALLHDELGALARRAGRPEIAALLRRRSEPAVAAAPALTLDEFSATLPTDMHSEAELLTLWRDAQAENAIGPRAGQRRQRLIKRQLDALRWLETLAVASPHLNDPVSAWLDHQVARRLGTVGIESLGDLLRWIEIHGHHWYRRVPRVGAQGAARTVSWLVGHADSLGALPKHALVPRPQIDEGSLAPAPTVGVVPLERLRLPPALSGAQGTNRAEVHRRRTLATDDLEAVQAWLGQHPPTSHTWRAYRREAERFLLWAVFERGKALSSLDATDCTAFHGFLAAPGADWVSPRHVPRGSDRWRPLEAGLSAGSIVTAIAIVRSLCGWLVRQRYLDADPWQESSVIDRDIAPTVSSRSLHDSDWALLQQWLASRPPSLSADRLRALIAFACHTGLRESELAAARTSWLSVAPHADGRLTWTVQIGAKDDRASPRTVDLPDAMAAQLLKYLRATGDQEHELPRAVDRPVFAHRSDPGRALTPGRIYTLIKSALRRCADASESSDPTSAARLRRASTHWLRHTHAMHLAATGTSLGELQRRLGHRSPGSSAAYLCASVAEDRSKPPN